MTDTPFADRGEHIKAALRKLVSIHDSGVVTILANYPRRVSGTRIVELSNMWPERSRFILDHLSQGGTITDAFHRSGYLYDTHDWREIVSRLYRSRGLVLNALMGFHWRSPQPSQILEREKLLSAICEGQDRVVECLRLIAHYPLTSFKKGNPPGPNQVPSGGCDQPTEDRCNPMGNLAQVCGFLRKCVRDIPEMPEKTGTAPTLNQRARANVELARLHRAYTLLQHVVESDGGPQPIYDETEADWLGIGLPYSPWLAGLLREFAPERHVAAHADPDADALTALWMLSRFLFTAQRVRVHFVSREHSFDIARQCDAAVGGGRVWNPAGLHFDHETPAFPSPDLTCATRLVWEELQRRAADVGHLRGLIEVVHNGSAASRRTSPNVYRMSKRNGLHAHIKYVKRWAASDQLACHAVSLWLDAMTFEGFQSTEPIFVPPYPAIR